MSSNKYEDKVRKRADEMAVAAFGSKFGFNTAAWRNVMKMARLSVAREAAAVQAAVAPNHEKDYIDGLLVVLGLIPPPKAE